MNITKNMTDEEMQKLFYKARILSMRTLEIPTYCGHNCYLISKSKLDHLLLIPSNVKHLNKGIYMDKIFTKWITDLTGQLTVVGGLELKNCNGMFDGCGLTSLNLDNLCTSKVTDMSNMFRFCRIANLRFQSMYTSKVKSMSNMFMNCKTNCLDLSTFNTSNVIKMYRMFAQCETNYIDFSNADISKVETMKEMFRDCKVDHHIDISKFNTCNVRIMTDIFARCDSYIKTTDARLVSAYEHRIRRYTY